MKKCLPAPIEIAGDRPRWAPPQLEFGIWNLEFAAFPRRVRVFGFLLFFFQRLRTGARTFLPAVVCLAAQNLLAQTNTAPLTAPSLPDAGASLLRVAGALTLVLGLFLGGVWLFKNWQRLSVSRGLQPKLNLLETRSLGARQAVFVVGYEKQRFLVATSPAGVNLLSHLPDCETAEAETAEKPSGPMPFAQALAQVLKRK
jgi:flagellar biogenesis protein FliO